VNKKINSSLMALAIALLSLIAVTGARAQDRQKTAAAVTTSAASSLLPALPASDVARFVDVP
jgi:ABC-type sugar transport system substrate-binding protein